MNVDPLPNQLGSAQAPFSVAIIGAGPVGLYAASLCAMLGLSVGLFESLPFVGGQCAALYPHKVIKGVPGFNGTRAKDFVRRLAQEAASSSVEFFLGTSVENVRKISSFSNEFLSEDAPQNVFELTHGTRRFFAKGLLIAAGMGRFHPNKPSFEESGSQQLLETGEGRYVHYSVGDPALFTNQNVAILGGGDSAVDWALELVTTTRSLSLIHRRDVFRCAAESAENLKILEQQGRIRIYRSAQIKALRGNQGRLTHIHISQPTQEFHMETDHLLVFYGLTTDFGLIDQWEISKDLQKNRQKIQVDFMTGATSVSGVFAIGDAVAYPENGAQKINLITAGFGEAVRAAYALRQYIGGKTAPNVQSLA